MSHAILFSTLAYANKLKQAGVPDKQAEAESEALAEVLNDQVASKKELLESVQKAETVFEKALLKTETRLIVRMDSKFAEVDNKFAEIGGKFAEIDGKLGETKVSIIQWMVSLMFAQLFASSALILAIFKFLH